MCDTPQTTSQLTIQSDFKSPSGHTLVLNHVAQEEDHHAGVHLEGNKDPQRPQHVSHSCCCSQVPLNSLCDHSRNTLIYRPLPFLHGLHTLPSPEQHQTSSKPSQLTALCPPLDPAQPAAGGAGGGTWEHMFPDTACHSHCRSNLQITEPRAQPQSAEQGKSHNIGTTNLPAFLQALHLELSLRVGD